MRGGQFTIGSTSRFVPYVFFCVFFILYWVLFAGLDLGRVISCVWMGSVGLGLQFGWLFVCVRERSNALVKLGYLGVGYQCLVERETVAAAGLRAEIE